ncbi:hypothetical protein D3C73_1234670 [compost metagenome]
MPTRQDVFIYSIAAINTLKPIPATITPIHPTGRANEMERLIPTPKLFKNHRIAQQNEDILTAVSTITVAGGLFPLPNTLAEISFLLDNRTSFMK